MAVRRTGDDPSRGSPREPRSLDAVQRWFQAVISHPQGVDDGIEAEEARRWIAVRAGEIEDVIRPSRSLASKDRLAVYANAYYARLLECLGESFPVLKRAVGEEVFNDFAFGYLQKYPSRSYTLNRLADDFAHHMEETRPDIGAPGVSWPDFLIDLARLEWTIAEVFDGPGTEGAPALDASKLRSIPPEKWPDARLVPVPCLKLLASRYPVSSYFTASRRAKAGEEIAIPDPGEELVAITRRDFIVWRHDLTRPQFLLLDGILSRKTVGESIRLAAEAAQAAGGGADPLEAALEEWFRDWTRIGFFKDVELS
ncbi:MAG TPA: DNA-binding domain-containing protein [Planctomycetota bacterium]|nr:DNA-binding domain-containing protein [Planctomycetota bacterium]